jgi:cytochrome bd-type quinol oxidase subunit 2
MIRRFFKQPFAAIVQGILVILLLVSFAMITQQLNETLYRIGFLLLIASTLVQIVFGNLPPEADFKQSIKFTAVVFIIIAIVFGLGILLAPYLVNLGRR